MDTATLTDISLLNPAEYNPRTISESDMESLKRSIQEFGFVENVVANKDGTIISGHQRVQAAKANGLRHVPVFYVDLPKDKEKALNIAMNRISGEFDMSKLPQLIEELPDDVRDLTGFSDKEISQMLNAIHLEEVVEDEAPPLPKEAKTKPGDLYALGNHRLLCGDATKIDDVERLMDGQKADMVFTDPPYGVKFQSMRADRFAVLKNDDTILTDWIAPVATNSKGWVFVWTTWKVLEGWLPVVEQFGKMSNMIVWHKGGGGIGDLAHTFSTDYEIALVFNRGAEVLGKRIGSVWSLKKDFAGSYEHPTQKPVALAAEAIEKTTLANNLVLDVFGGSGTTLLACEQLNRKCYMMELDPKYCDVIVQRWENFTKQKAVLVS